MQNGSSNRDREPSLSSESKLISAFFDSLFNSIFTIQGEIGDLALDLLAENLSKRAFKTPKVFDNLYLKKNREAKQRFVICASGAIQRNLQSQLKRHDKVQVAQIELDEVQILAKSILEEFDRSGMLANADVSNRLVKIWAFTDGIKLQELRTQLYGTDISTQSEPQFRNQKDSHDIIATPPEGKKLGHEGETEERFPMENGYSKEEIDAKLEVLRYEMRAETVGLRTELIGVKTELISQIHTLRMEAKQTEFLLREALNAANVKIEVLSGQIRVWGFVLGLLMPVLLLFVNKIWK